MQADGYERYKKCSAMVESCMKEDKVISFLLDELQKNKCKIKDEESLLNFRCGNIRSQHKEDAQRKIVIGQGTGQDEKKKFCSSLRHELIHSYDMCVDGISVVYNSHMACTEVHAYNLFSCDEDEVKKLAPVFDKNVSRKERARAQIPEQLHQNCVWQLALKSLKVNSNFSKEKGTKSLETVWNRCYNNLRPFGERQKLGPVDTDFVKANVTD